MESVSVWGVRSVSVCEGVRVSVWCVRECG